MQHTQRQLYTAKNKTTNSPSSNHTPKYHKLPKLQPISRRPSQQAKARYRSPNTNTRTQNTRMLPRYTTLTRKAQPTQKILHRTSQALFQRKLQHRQNHTKNAIQLSHTKKQRSHRLPNSRTSQLRRQSTQHRQRRQPSKRIIRQGSSQRPQLPHKAQTNNPRLQLLPNLRHTYL